MRIRRLLPALALASLGCRADTYVTNPNTPTSATFWKTASDANVGVIATYNSLAQIGVYQRWMPFSYDLRSDNAVAISPNADLSNHSKFAFTNYDYEVVNNSWYQPYQGVSRANQVIAYVPGIAMDAATRDTYVAEAKFIRALHYWHLLTLWGGNIPLITAPVRVTDRPGPGGEAAIYAQIETDFADAAAVLPKTAFASSGGRAVAASAQAMLGKTLLQERKWADAAAALAPVVNQQYGNYSLFPDYARLFTVDGNNSVESVFEAQSGNPGTVSQGVYGLNTLRYLGPCGPAFCDGRPTRWFFNQFLTDSTTDGRVDPRLDATIFYYKGDTTMVHGLTWGARKLTGDGPSYADTTRIYFRKYSEYYAPSDPNTISWDAPINFKAVRYADVLLMYAEALNEAGQSAAAAPYVNQVRARVRLKPLPALGQAGMRDAILKERLLEFGLEAQRWLDMRRQNLLTAANLPAIISHDDEFTNFVVGKSELYPIPTSELNLNPNLKQNPGW